MKRCNKHIGIKIVKVFSLITKTGETSWSNYKSKNSVYIGIKKIAQNFNFIKWIPLLSLSIEFALANQEVPCNNMLSRGWLLNYNVRSDLALFTNVALLSKLSCTRIRTASTPLWNVKSNCNTKKRSSGCNWCKINSVQWNHYYWPTNTF